MRPRSTRSYSAARPSYALDDPQLTHGDVRLLGLAPLASPLIRSSQRLAPNGSAVPPEGPGRPPSIRRLEQLGYVSCERDYGKRRPARRAAPQGT